jgi:hypothetical protein
LVANEAERLGDRGYSDIGITCSVSVEVLLNTMGRTDVGSVEET